MKRPASQNKRVGVLRMAFRARKVFGTFEKRALGSKLPNRKNIYRLVQLIDHRTAVIVIASSCPGRTARKTTLRIPEGEAVHF